MDAGATVAAGGGFLQSILSFMDSQAQLLGAGGYQALAAPGSTLTLVVAGFLTLFVALVGYRLMLGQGPDLRTAVLAFVKIGIVLAFASSWPAYRTLVYDVAVRGPAEVAGEIGAPSGLPGTGGDLVARLDGVDRALVVLAILGEGTPPLPVAPNQAPALDVPPQPYPGFNTFAMGGARMVFLVTAIAGLGAVRLIAGLLLAFGPFFIAFLLFDNTRSLFEGWVRVLAGAALAALGASIALAVQLALLEPWLTNLLARRSAQEWIPGMPVELLVITTAFALVILAMLYASAKIAFAFRLAPLWQGAGARIWRRLRAEEGNAAAAAGARRDAQAAEGRSRAAAVVDAVAATQRREGAQAAILSADRFAGEAVGGAAPGTRRAAPAGLSSDASQPLSAAPLGQRFPRRTRGRVSASAGRRDSSL